MRIGEIVETCSVSFTAQSDLHQPPPLGSLVKIEMESETGQSAGGKLYAVVSFAQTTGLEPGRPAIRRGTDDVYDSAIYEEHPELRRTLRTVFQGVMVGWQDKNRLYQHLPPQPPPLHYSVRECDASEVKLFSDKLYYLRLLLSTTIDLPVPLLVTAHINQTYRVRGEDQAWIEGVARELATLLKQDSEMLMSILYAIDPSA